MNIPGLSERTLRHDFEKSGVSVNSDIQVIEIALKSYVSGELLSVCLV